MMTGIPKTLLALAIVVVIPAVVYLSVAVVIFMALTASAVLGEPRSVLVFGHELPSYAANLPGAVLWLAVAGTLGAAVAKGRE